MPWWWWRAFRCVTPFHSKFVSRAPQVAFLRAAATTRRCTLPVCMLYVSACTCSCFSEKFVAVEKKLLIGSSKVGRKNLVMSGLFSFVCDGYYKRGGAGTNKWYIYGCKVVALTGFFN